MKQNLLLLFTILFISPVLQAEEQPVDTNYIYKIDVFRGGVLRNTQVIHAGLRKEAIASKSTDVKFVAACIKQADGSITNTYDHQEIGFSYHLTPIKKNKDGTMVIDYSVHWSEQTSIKKSEINKNICVVDSPKFVSQNQNGVATIGNDPFVVSQSDDLQIVITALN